MIEIFEKDFYARIKDIKPKPFSLSKVRFPLSKDQTLILFTSLSYLHHLDDIATWMEEGKKAIFLEGDLGKIQFFLMQKQYENVKDSPGVSFVYLDSDDTIKAIGMQHLGESYSIYSEDEALKNHINRMIQGVMLATAEFQDFGARTFRNVYHNINACKSIKDGEALFGKFKKIPAIICGAGPSFEEAVPFLQEAKNKALLFAGGSALERISNHHIPIHFAASIDPDPNKKRFLNFTQFQTPFLVQFRMSHEIFKLIQGEKIWMGRSSGFPFEEVLYYILKLPNIQFDGGWVVSNYLCHIAYLLGCDPIILVGMDHSWPKEENAPSGIECLDMHGNAVYTKSDFFWAADWFSEFAKAHKEVTILNATAKGLAIEGIKHLDLQSALKPLRSIDIDGYMQSVIMLARSLDLTSAPLVFQQFIRSMQQCRGFCEKALGTYEASVHHNQPILPIDQSIEEIADELFYQTILKPMWEIWKYPHMKNNPYWEVSQVLLYLDIIHTYLQIFVA